MGNLFSKNDPQYLRSIQYKDDAKLAARVVLHEQFSKNKQGWHQWVFSLINLQPQEVVLELGCGTGALWSTNLNKIPESCNFLLTDFSPGIVESLRKKFVDFPCIVRFDVMDAEKLTTPDASFDVVIANHMLYHVTDRSGAIHEMARVLTHGGRLIVSTNGEVHLRELDELISTFFSESKGGVDDSIKNFRLENGKEQLLESFSHVETHIYDDQLIVTEAQPLVDYILSLPVSENKDPADIERLTKHIAEYIHTNGAFVITKSVGAFVCRK